MKSFGLSSKIISLIPAAALLVLIFYFSSLPAPDSSVQSMSVTETILLAADRMMHLQMTGKEIAENSIALENYVRKAAHFTEFFLLSLSLTIPLYNVYALRGRRLLLAAPGFCILYAASDEFHQFFSNGRSPRFSDVLIDSAGSLAAFALFFLILYLKRSGHRKHISQ